MKIYILRRKKDGGILQYTERYKTQVQDMVNSGNFEIISESEQVDPRADRVIQGAFVVEDTLECPLCGKVCVDENGLRVHKSEHYGPKPS